MGAHSVLPRERHNYIPWVEEAEEWNKRKTVKVRRVCTLLQAKKPAPIDESADGKFLKASERNPQKRPGDE